MSSILVLGGAGYIGSHTVYELIAVGENVVVVDNLETGFRKAVHQDANFIREISGTRHLEILGWKPKFDDLETIITTAWE